MSTVKIKICGLMREEDVVFCQEAGADVLGFVTEYPLPVPWNLTRQKAADLMARVSLPHKSCIVTGGSPEKILDLARELKPDLIQLHFRETLEDTKQILQALEPLGGGVIKTVPPDGLERIRQFGTEDLSAIASLLEKAGVYAILADSRTPENAARVSKNLDKVLFCSLMEVSRKPVILAGGITPENIGEILEDCGASFIDVMTGVENSPGVKDREKILGLIQAARAEKILVEEGDSADKKGRYPAE